MSRKSQTIGHLTFCWPSDVYISESSQSLSQILKGRCLQLYGYPRILSIPIPKNSSDMDIPFSYYLGVLD